MNTFFQQVWLRRGWVALALWPVAQVYGWLVWFRRLLYQHHFLQSTRVPIPTIVVGNVIVGGAGKTPLVMLLVEHLQGLGLKVGVVSRGFGRLGPHCIEVLPQTSSLEAGDEPVLIRRTTGAPVFVAKQRAEAALALLRVHPETDVLICDDGLQHHALSRDIEIAVFDDRGVGNGFLLPAGPLREPWPTCRERRIDLVLHTGNKPAFEGFTSERRLSGYAVNADGVEVSLSSLIGRKLIAVAGIARPEAFFEMLSSCGLTLEQRVALPDHYNFVDFQLPSSPGYTLLCTEKDAVKLFELESLRDRPIFAVPLQFSVQASFLTALDALLIPRISGLPSAHGHKTA